MKLKPNRESTTTFISIQMSPTIMFDSQYDNMDHPNLVTKRPVKKKKKFFTVKCLGTYVDDGEFITIIGIF